jgi:glycosyltransferase involved in cell wall biosynthesis
MPATLTITIPTYNRAVHVVGTVKTLLPQLNEKCQLLVLDNCSEEPVASALSSLLAGHPNAAHVQVQRNKENVGCVANIMKAIETPSTEWVWTFGDDDAIEPDAVSRLLTFIAECEAEVAAIHLVSVFSPPGDLLEHVRTISFEEYLHRPCALVEMSFLGQFVLRRSALRNAIKYGYHFAYSCFPHVAVIAMALEEGRRIKMVPANLHDLPPRNAGRSDHYRSLPLILGTPTLAELPLGASRAPFLQQLRRYQVRAVHSLLFDCLIRMGRPELRAEAVLLFEQSFARLEAVGLRPRDRLLLTVGSLLQRSPTAAYHLARTIRRWMRDDVNENVFMRPIHAGLL